MQQAAAEITVKAKAAPFVNSLIDAMKMAEKSYSLKVNVDEKSFVQPLGRISAQIGEFDKSLKASNARVLAFGASAGIIYNVNRAFTELIGSAIKVDKALTEINVNLNLSKSRLSSFGAEIFKIGKETAQGFDIAAKAAAEFSRQGLGYTETILRTRDALILSRRAAIDSTKAVEDLTAAVNSYARDAYTTTEIINKLVKVDTNFAVSSGDIAEALKRVGSSAAEAGVGLDNLIGLVTSAQQITARGGAVIGNALKTIFTKIGSTDTIDQLRELGVQITSTQTAFEKLKSISNAVKVASVIDAAKIKEITAGIYQYNILSATLGDLSNQYSIQSRAAEASRRATNEALIGNEQLNKSLDATIRRIKDSAMQFGSNVGGGMVGPVLGMVDKFMGQLAGNTSDVEGKGRSVGSIFAKGIASGIGEFLSGPGFIGIFYAITKLGLNFAKDAVAAIKSVADLNTVKHDQALVEKIISQEMSRQDDIINKMKSGLVQVHDLEVSILNAIRAQVIQKEIASKITPTVYNSILREGFAIKGDGFVAKKASGGFLPEARERAGAVAGGYTPGLVKMTNIQGVGNVMYNSAETVKKFPQFTQPAIMPPANSKAGTNYRSAFVSSHGFDPYAADGFVPNFSLMSMLSMSKRGFGAVSEVIKPGKVFDLMRGKVGIGDFAEELIAIAKEPTKFIKSEEDINNIRSMMNMAMSIGPVREKMAQELSQRISSVSFSPTEAVRPFTQGGQHKDEEGFAKYRLFGGSLDAGDYSKNLGRALQKNKDGSYSFGGRSFHYNDTRDAIQRAILGMDNPFSSISHVKEFGVGPYGKNKYLGYTFLLGRFTGQYQKTPRLRATYNDKWDVDLHPEEEVSLSDYFKTKTFNKDKKYDYKSYSGGIDGLILRKLVSGIKGSNPVTFRGAMNFKEGDFYDGFIPNFSPLSSAIAREQLSGVPMSAIRVGTSPSLTSSLNPSGLGVYNTIDEPAGLSQGIARAASQGLNPKTHGVPNFALYDAPFESRDPLKFGARMDFQGMLKDRIEALRRKVQEGVISFDEINKETNKLKKEFALFANDVSRIRASLKATARNYTGNFGNLRSSTDIAMAGLPIEMAASPALIASATKYAEVNSFGLNPVFSKAYGNAGPRVGPFSVSPSGQAYSVGAMAAAIKSVLTSEGPKLLTESVSQVNNQAMGFAGVRSGPFYVAPGGSTYAPRSRGPLPLYSSNPIEAAMQRNQYEERPMMTFDAATGQVSATSSITQGELERLRRIGASSTTGSGPWMNPFARTPSGYQRSDPFQDARNKKAAYDRDQLEAMMNWQPLYDANKKRADDAAVLASMLGSPSASLPAGLSNNVSAKERERISSLMSGIGGIFLGGSRINKLRAMGAKNPALFSSGAIDNTALDEAENRYNSRLNSIGFAATIAGPILGQTAREAIGDNSRLSRGTGALFGGIGNALGYAGLGMNLTKNPLVGGGVGFAVGMTMEAQRIATAFTSDLPDLERESERLRQKISETADALSRYIEATERLSDTTLNDEQKRRFLKIQSEQLTKLPMEHRTAVLGMGSNVKQLESYALGLSSSEDAQKVVEMETREYISKIKEDPKKYLGYFRFDDPGAITKYTPAGYVRSAINWFQDSRNEKTPIPKETENVIDAISSNLLSSQGKGGSLLDVLYGDSSLLSSAKTPQELLSAIEKIAKEKDIKGASGIIGDLRGLKPGMLERMGPRLLENFSPEKLGELIVPRGEQIKNETLGRILNLGKLGDQTSFFDERSKLAKSETERLMASTTRTGNINLGVARAEGALALQSPFLLPEEIIKRKYDYTIEAMVQSLTGELDDIQGAFKNSSKTTTLSWAESFLRKQTDIAAASERGIEQTIKSRNEATEITDKVQKLISDKGIGSKEVMDEINSKIVEFSQGKMGADNIRSSTVSEDRKAARDSFLALRESILSLTSEMERSKNDTQEKGKIEIEIARAKAKTEFDTTKGARIRNTGFNFSPNSIETIASIQMAQKMSGTFQASQADVEMADFLNQSGFGLPSDLRSRLIEERATNLSAQGVENPYSTASEYIKSRYSDELPKGNVSITQDMRVGAAMGGIELGQRKEADLAKINALAAEELYLQEKITGELYKQAIQTNDLAKIMSDTNYSTRDALSGMVSSFAAEFKYNAKDLYTDMVNGAAEVGATMKASFKDAFKSFVDGSASAKDALRNFGLSVANRILDKTIDMSSDMLFGALGSIGSSFIGRKDGGLIKGYAGGGKVVGGSGTKDDVPAVLSKGEYVIRKSSVDKYGDGFFAALNKGGMVGFNSGGSVRLNLRNDYIYNDPRYPTAGTMSVDPNLSNFALSNEDDLATVRRMEKEQALIDYLIDKSSYDREKQNALDAYENEKKQRLIGAYISAGIGIAGAGISAGITEYRGSQANARVNANTATGRDYRLAAKYQASRGEYGLAAQYGKIGSMKNVRPLANGGFIGFAGGGLYGSGSDNVPAMLMGGEYVLNKSTVSRVGVDYLNQLNSGSVKGFADGGYVGNTPIAPTVQGGNETSQKMLDGIMRLVEGNQKIAEILEIKQKNIEKSNASNSQESTGGYQFYVTNNITMESNGNVSGSGEKAQDEGGAGSEYERGKKMAETIQIMFRQMLIKELRPNGMIKEAISSGS
jgi:TP901 family phage tail tape measure protein